MTIHEAQNLGEVLLHRGLLSAQQLAEAMEVYQKTGDFFPSILVNQGYLSFEQIDEAIAYEYGLEYVDLANVQIQKEAISKIKPSVARLYGVMPISYDQDVLKVAISDPANTQVMDDLRFMLACDLRSVIAPAEEIETAINKYYGAELESINDIMGDLAETMPQLAPGRDDEMNPATADIATLEAMSKEAPVIKLLNLVLVQAIKDKASDIHFEPFETDYKIRYRIDGVLYEMMPPPKHLSMALASRIKVMANLNIAETRLPQDGRIQLKVMGRYVDLRVSTLPTSFGESIVLRILDQANLMLSLDEVGLQEDDKKKIRGAIGRPNGIIIVTGPTGSGKTTTLYSALKEINTIDTKIITAEDPVEYDIDGICQIPINDGIGLTYATCLRSILRQDPDIIFVGEIRDFETGQIAIQASLTGHLVLTTLHTNDAPSSISRMIDMQIEPFLISSTLQVVLAQRLIRKLCMHCREPFEPTDEDLMSIELSRSQVKGKTFFRAKGCPKCNGIGYRGRAGIFEILEINDAIRRLILAKVPSAKILQVAQENGFRTMREDGLQKIFEGMTSIEEVARET